MKEIAQYLIDKYGRWGWLGQRFQDAEGINDFLPLDLIICCDHGSDAKRFFDEKKIFSIEKSKGIRENWSNEHLNRGLSGSFKENIFEEISKSKTPLNLICYRSIASLEEGTDVLDGKLKIYAVPEGMKRYFDDKVRLFKNITELSVPVIPFKSGKLSGLMFSELKRTFKTPFIVQFPYGSSGNNIFLIENEEEFSGLQDKCPGSPVNILKYIEGFSLNVNAVIILSPDRPRIICSFPSVQIIGAPECSSKKLSFCGNDFTAAKNINRSIIRGVEENVSKIGAWMASEGYSGIFGLDLVTDGDKVFTVEINPRFQNSTSLFNMLSTGTDPLFILHVAAFLLKEDAAIRKYIGSYPFNKLMEPVDGSQVILHNGLGSSFVNGRLLPGMYSDDGPCIEHVSTDGKLMDCNRDGEFIITCAVPYKNTPVAPNAPICKIQSLTGALDSDNNKLSMKTRSKVRNIYDGLKLREVEKVVK